MYVGICNLVPPPKNNVYNVSSAIELHTHGMSCTCMAKTYHATFHAMCHMQYHIATSRSQYLSIPELLIATSCATFPRMNDRDVTRMDTHCSFVAHDHWCCLQCCIALYVLPAINVWELFLEVVEFGKCMFTDVGLDTCCNIAYNITHNFAYNFKVPCYEIIQGQ